MVVSIFRCDEKGIDIFILLTSVNQTRGPYLEYRYRLWCVWSGEKKDQKADSRPARFVASLGDVNKIFITRLKILRKMPRSRTRVEKYLQL